MRTIDLKPGEWILKISSPLSVEIKPLARENQKKSSGKSPNLKIPPKIRKAAKKFHLTPREIEVLALLAAGDTWKECADKIGISVHTVNFHAKNLRLKMGTKNIIHAVAKLFSESHHKNEQV